MSLGLAEDLLKQSRNLVAMDLTRPKQASLRRAISTAYYALFHLLVDDAARRLAPRPLRLLQVRIGRAFQHGEMKEVCREFTRVSASRHSLDLWPQSPSPALVRTAQIFLELQEARHSADYDVGAVFTKPDALTRIGDAELAFRHWRSVRNTEEADIFRTSLAFGRRLAR